MTDHRESTIKTIAGWACWIYPALLVFAGALLLVEASRGAVFERTFPALTQAGTTESVDLKQIGSGAFGAYGVQIRTTGAPTACSMDLQGSIDGQEWHELNSDAAGATVSVDCTAGGMFFVVFRPVRHLRGRLNTLTGGVSPTVTIILYALED